SADLAPLGLAVDRDGNLFIAENLRVRKVSTTGIITTVAGNGSGRHSGDGGLATSTPLDCGGTCALAVNATGDLFIAGKFDYRIRKVSPEGIITTVAGTGTAGYSGDGGPAAKAQLDGVAGMAVDVAGKLYIADSHNNRVRMVSPDGTITTVAG